MKISAAGRTKTYELDGLTVCAPNTQRVYVPKQAVKLFFMPLR